MKIYKESVFKLDKILQIIKSVTLERIDGDI